VIGGVVMSIGMLVFDGRPLGRTLSTAALLALLYNIASQAVSHGAVVQRARAVCRLRWLSLGVLLVPTIAVLGSMLILQERPTLLDGMGPRAHHLRIGQRPASLDQPVAPPAQGGVAAGLVARCAPVVGDASGRVMRGQVTERSLPGRA
jgi:hypothetical protein